MDSFLKTLSPEPRWENGIGSARGVNGINVGLEKTSADDAVSDSPVARRSRAVTAAFRTSSIALSTSSEEMRFSFA